MKCDETKPACKKCQTARRVCDGYLDADHSMSRRRLAETVRTLAVVGPVSRALTRSPSLLAANPASRPVSPDDTTFFDLFRHATVPSTCSFFPSRFWKADVMQLAHIEPAIWHAAVTLGTLHQRSEALARRDEDTSARLSRRAAAHYGKAMALAKGLDSPIKLATLSIALVAATGMMDRLGEMQMHVLAGLKLVARDETHSAVIRCLEGSLMRADLQAMTFSDSKSPYPYEESASTYDIDNFLSKPVAQESDLSYEELTSELFGLIRGYFILDDGLIAGKLTYGPWLTRMDGFMRRLTRWEERIARYEASRPSQAGEEEQMNQLSLRLYHVTLRAMLQAGPFGAETRYDVLLGHYEYAVRLAATLQSKTRALTATDRALSLSLEPGMIIPLWAVSHRCRHTRIRHAALRILAEANRVEAIWQSHATAKVLGALVSVEEESLRDVLGGIEPWTPPLIDAAAFPGIPWSAWSRPGFEIPCTASWDEVPLVPEEAARVRDLLGKTVLEERRVEVRLLMTPVDPDEPYGPPRDVVIYF